LTFGGCVGDDMLDFEHVSAIVARHEKRTSGRAARWGWPPAGSPRPSRDQLDGVCESCHLEFWYPSQKKLVDAIRKAGGDAALK